MIDDFITLLGIPEGFEFFGLFIGCILITCVFIQFLNIINFIFKSIGGF